MQSPIGFFNKKRCLYFVLAIIIYSINYALHNYIAHVWLNDLRKYNKNAFSSLSFKVIVDLIKM